MDENRKKIFTLETFMKMKLLDKYTNESNYQIQNSNEKSPFEGDMKNEEFYKKL